MTKAQWISTCEDNPDAIVAMLEDRDGCQLFMAKERFLSGHNYYYTTPVYSVWDHDYDVLFTTNYREAYHAYELR